MDEGVIIAEKRQAVAAWIDPGLDLCTFDFKLLISLILTTFIFRPRAVPMRSLEGFRDIITYFALVFHLHCFHFDAIFSR
jgi:hypothetical protein